MGWAGRWIGLVGVIWVFFLSGVHSFAASHEARFRVASFNIYLAFTPGKFQSFGKYLRSLAESEDGGPDVILLQEAFALGEIKNLQRRAHYWSYAVKGDFMSAGMPSATSSGLAILSKTPLFGKKMVSLPSCNGADCLAAKGAVLIQTRIPGFPKSVFFGNTHLNADYTNQDNAVPRREQLQLLEEFYRRELGDGPAILGGDYNALPDNPDLMVFQRGLSLMNASGVCGLMKALCMGFLEFTIDHHLYRGWDPERTGLSIEATGYRRRRIPAYASESPYPLFRFPDGKVALSDHSSLEVEYRVRW